MLLKVDTHSFESISGQERNQTWVLFFQLVCNVFERLPHSILDHLFLSLLDLLESLVEISKDLAQEGRTGLLYLLANRSYSFLV